MYKFSFIIGLILSSCVGSIAQTLHFDLPYYKGKEAVVVVKQGVRNDTLQRIVFDAFGKASTATSKLERPALAALLIGTGVQFPFILSPTENIVLSGRNEALTPQNTTVSSSLENAEIARWGMETNVLNAKITGINQILPLYTEGSPFSKNLIKERNSLAKSIGLLSDTLKISPLFAAKYLKITDFFESLKKGTPQYMASKDIPKIGKTAFEALHNAFLTDVDVAALYGSGLWFELLNNSLIFYEKGSPFHEKLGEDMVVLMKKNTSNAVVTDLAEAAISICTQFSWDKDQTAIVDYLTASNRIENPRGSLKKLLQMQAMTVGKKAPDLILTQHIGRVEDHNHQTTVLKSNEFSDNQTLVIFYQSGCGHCETTMNSLRDNYENLTKKGVKIIAISADTDDLVFRNTANSYPWKDSYCDLDGTKGVNFKNYAVLGTPTMILVDKKGNIAAKIASTEELLEQIKQDFKF